MLLHYQLVSIWWADRTGCLALWNSISVWAFVAVVKPLFGTFASHFDSLIMSSGPVLHSSYLLMQQQVMTQVTAYQLSTWETWIEFLASDFSFTQPCLLINISLCFSLSPCLSPLFLLITSHFPLPSKQINKYIFKKPNFPSDFPLLWKCCTKAMCTELSRDGTQLEAQAGLVRGSQLLGGWWRDLWEGTRELREGKWGYQAGQASRQQL